MAKGNIKYKKEYAEDLPEMFKNGESVAEVVAILGVWRSTFYEWVNKYPEFKEAYEHGKTLSEAWWAKLGRQGASCEKQINPAVWIFNMKAKFDWSDKGDNENNEDDDHVTKVEIVRRDKKD